MGRDQRSCGRAFRPAHLPWALWFLLPPRSKREHLGGRRLSWQVRLESSRWLKPRVMIFSSAALGAVAVVRLVKLPGPRRLALAAALVVAALLAALAGGPVSDSLLGRGGTTGLVRIALEPNWTDFTPFEQAGPALVRVGIIPLIVISAFIAFRRRSWGLAFLTATGVFALVEAVLVQASNPIDDARILYSANAVGLLVLLAGLGCLISDLRGGKRTAAVLAVLLLAVLPTVLPPAIPGARLAAEGFRAGRPSSDGSDYPFVGQSSLHRELIENWDFYQWLAPVTTDSSSPTDHTPKLRLRQYAGVASPTSASRACNCCHRG